MTNGLPRKAKVGVPGNSVNIDPATYFTALRMENVGMLRPGQALMLAATLPTKPRPGAAKRGKKK
jgi:hypothetical protein